MHLTLRTFPAALLAITLAGAAHALSFQPPITQPLGNNTLFSHDIATADLDHDGDLDVVVVDWVSNDVDVILNTGGGTLGPVSRMPSADAPYSITLADVNHDTHLDLITGNRAGASVSVWLGTGTGTFGPRLDLAAPALVSMADVGDIDGDGNLDIVAACDLRVAVFRGNGTGGFSAPTSTVLGTSLALAQTWALAVGDLDGDGDADIVTNYAGPLVTLINDGSGGLTRVDYNTSLQARAIAIADLDGDGRKDIVAGGDAHPGVTIFRGTVSGYNEQPFIPTGSTPSSLAIRDLDGDGRLDLVVPNIGANTLTVLRALPGGNYENTTVGTEISPIAAVCGDLNGDGFVDILETGYSGNLIVRYQAPTGGGGASQTALGSGTASYPFGAPVPLVATISPPTATGTVRFLRDGAPLGIALVSGGAATLSDSLALGGIHTYVAEYSGDALLAPSLSGPLQIEITPAPTTTTLESSSNPSPFGFGVLLTARVTASPAAPVQGLVIFRLDGALWISRPVDIETGEARVLAGDLPLGHHAIQASYEGNANHLSSLSPVLDQVIGEVSPTIVSVRDVRGDQGGKVMIKWDALADSPGSGFAEGYRIWRRAPTDAAIRAAGVREGRYQPFAGASGTAVDYWEAIAELPAEGLRHYAYAAATLQDSLPDSNPYTAFFVSLLAVTGETFPSAPDSGYSVDNLSPPSPGAFVALYGQTGTTAHWGPTRAPDFRNYRIFQGTELEFVPGPGNLVLSTSDTSGVLPAGAFFYKLAAFDVHENASRYLVVTPQAPVGTLASLLSLEWQGGAIRGRWYSTQGAGSTATLHRREADTPWATLGTLTFDGTGVAAFLDETAEPGRRYGYRLGILEDGEERFTTEAWLDPAGSDGVDFALQTSNPTPTASWNLRFRLDREGAVSLQLVDVLGRIVSRHELGVLPAGLHTATLAGGGELRAGVYLLRISRGGAIATRRVVLTR